MSAVVADPPPYAVAPSRPEAAPLQLQVPPGYDATEPPSNGDAAGIVTTTDEHRPDVHITIGRIEVQAGEQPRPAPVDVQPPLSLADYLEQRARS